MRGKLGRFFNSISLLFYIVQRLRYTHNLASKRDPVASTLTKKKWLLTKNTAIFAADCTSSSSFILYSAGIALYTSLFTLQQMRQLKRLHVLLSELRLMSFILMTSKKKAVKLATSVWSAGKWKARKGRVEPTWNQVIERLRSHA